MKSRLSLTLDNDVEEAIRLQATVLEIPLSRYINKLLRESLNLQNKNIEDALERLKRKGEVEV